MQRSHEWRSLQHQLVQYHYENLVLPLESPFLRLQLFPQSFRLLLVLRVLSLLALAP